MACQQIPEDQKSVYTCASPTQGRAAAMCFAAGDRIYIAGGRIQDGTYPNTLLLYSPTTDTWTESDSLPLLPRVNGTACATEQGVFLGLGYAGGDVHYDSLYLHDWWRFDPATDTWTRLADYPAPQTTAAVSWYDGARIWIACAFHAYTNDVWYYDISANRWTQASQPSPMRVMAAVGAQCQGRWFIGTGFHNYSQNEWYEWTADEQWTRRASVPGKGRHNAACAATEEAVYVLGGWHYGDSLTTGFHYEDILRYTPQSDSWTYCGTIPCGKTENGVACGIKNRLYFGLGEDPSGQIHNDWYYIED